MKSIVVNSNDAGQRLDKFLQKHFPDLTVDCLFVDKVENLGKRILRLTKSVARLKRC